MTAHTETDALHQLLGILPATIRGHLNALPEEDLLEVVLDLGRTPQARFPDMAVALGDIPVSHDDLDRIVAAVGEFGADNRAGIEGTLHRISCIRNRRGRIIGLTLRVGRAVFGTIDLIRDLVEAGTSVLLLGRPGVGKTTKLREVTRVLADDLRKRVVVIDTSNEIAGDGDVPHPAIGGARRMMVPHPDQQHAVMIEAVENHMPEVIVVDEIGTAAEAMAARTIAERGVQLIGTAHGNTLENLVANPTLADLVGGVQTVTLGDDEARLRGTQKTITERKGPPSFDAVVEIVNRDELIIHRDAGAAVDQLLRGHPPQGQHRGAGGGSTARRPAQRATVADRAEAGAAVLPPPADGTVRIHAYALSRDSVERVIRDLRLDARTVKHPENAQLIVTLRSRADDARLRRIVQATGVPVHAVKRNSTAQIRHLLQGLFNIVHGVEDDTVADAVREAELAVQQALAEGVAVALTPRSPSLRKVQHRIAARHHLVAESEGSEPQRHLVIHPA